MSNSTTMGREGAGYPRGYAESYDDGLDLNAIIAFVYRRLYLIITIGLLVFSGALLYALAREPQYEGEVAAMLQPQGDIEVLLEFDPEARPRASGLFNEIEEIQSTGFLTRVVEQNNLLEHPEFEHIVAGEPAPARSAVARFVERLDVNLSLSQPSLAASDGAAEGEVSAQDLARVIAERLEVASPPNTDVVSVSFTATSPDAAAEIANLVVDEYLAYQASNRAQTAERANAFLDDRLNELREEVRIAEQRVAEFAGENTLVEDAGQNSVVEQRLEQVSAQLSQARADVGSAEARLRRLNAVAANNAPPEAILEVVSSGVIENLRAQRGELRRRLSENSTRYRDAHPAMIQLREELWEVEQQISAELNRITAAVRSELEVARSQVAAFEEEITQLQGQRAEGGVARIQLRELQRSAESARALYESFLNRSAEISQHSRLDGDRARIISHALPPTAPAGPSLLMILAIGVVLAGGAGLGGAFLAELLDRGIRTRDQAEESLGVHVLSSVPWVAHGAFRRNRLADMVVDEPLGAFAESIRTIRSAVAASDLDSRTQALMFTSALPGEGKTTTAIAVARSAAEAGQRTLLIDCDLRNSRVAQKLKLKRSDNAGLAAVLREKAPFEQAIVRDPETTLDVLLPEKDAAATVELFSNHELKRLLDGLRESYDLVVIDTAPVLAVEDTRQIAVEVDAVVYVVAWSSTPRDVASQGVEALLERNAPLRGAVLTKMNLKKMQRSGYGDPAFYYRRYRNYYAR